MSFTIYAFALSVLGNTTWRTFFVDARGLLPGRATAPSSATSATAQLPPVDSKVGLRFSPLKRQIIDFLLYGLYSALTTFELGDTTCRSIFVVERGRRPGGAAAPSAAASMSATRPLSVDSEVMLHYSCMFLLFVWALVCT